MSKISAQPPLYDRRRFEALVMEHKLRVYLARKKAEKSPSAGVKASG